MHFTVAPGTDFAAAREAELDALADLVEHHLDMPAIERLLADGVSPTAPFVPPGAPE